MRPFLIGAMGYPALELLWRGRTHPSMALAGGLGAAMIHRVNRTSLSPVRKSLLCGAGITAIEAACGLRWNRRHQVWDYRRMPLNWRGQVCLPYSALWCLLSSVYMKAKNQMRRR